MTDLGLMLLEGPTVVYMYNYVIFVVDQNSAGDEHRAGQTAAQQGTGREGGRNGRTPILHAEKGNLDTRGQNKGTPSVKTTDRLGQ